MNSLLRTCLVGIKSRQYIPAKEKDTGAAVLVRPGGAYNILAWNLEGTEVAAWLNSLASRLPC